MNKLYKAILVLACWPVLACAQGASDREVWNEMTGEKLLALKAKADPARGEIAFEVCQGCHRRDASGRVSGAFPRLAGQHASVLIKQMTDIRSGKRENPKMDPFVGGHVVTPQEIADIAAYLQGLPIPTNNGKGTGDNLARGKDLFAKDCASCHGDHGEGMSEKFYPMVAAQHYRYLLREIRMIRDGERHNANPDMVKVVKPYSDGDMDAVADFMSRMEPPKK